MTRRLIARLRESDGAASPAGEPGGTSPAGEDRTAALDALIRHIKRVPGVAFVTAGQVADWVLGARDGVPGGR